MQQNYNSSESLWKRSTSLLKTYKLIYMISIIVNYVCFSMHVYFSVSGVHANVGFPISVRSKYNISIITYD